MNELAVETGCKVSVGQMSLCLVVDAVHDPVQPTRQAALNSGHARNQSEQHRRQNTHTHPHPFNGPLSLCLVVDAVHDPVQPTGQAAPAEVVRRLCRQSQEENRA